MKIIIITILFLGVLTSCAKGPEKVEAFLIKDCTGSYLRIENEDYLISNKSIVEDIQTDTKVDVNYVHVNKVEEDQGFACLMYHEYTGIVEITKIK